MMRLGILILTAILITASLCISSLAQRVSDREAANLKGPVRSVRVIHESGPRSGARETIKYDVNGNEVERQLVSDFGEQIGTQFRVFDAAGNLDRSTLVDPDGIEKEESRFTFKGLQPVEIQRFDASGALRERTVRILGSNGIVAEERYFDPKNERAKTIFTYDQRRNVVEAAFFLIDGQKATAPFGPCLGGHRVVFEYDDRDRPISKTLFDIDGDKKKSWSFSYDEKGNYLVYTVRSPSSVTSVAYTYEYDANGNWIKSTSVSESDDGLLELMLKATGHEAKPDELQELKMKASKPIRVIRREITYY